MRAPHILIVDDEPDIRSMLMIFLSRLGYTIDVAGSGNEALRCLSAQTPDLAVVDINLPDCSGFDLCQPIKAGGSTPVLLISGNATMDEDERRAASGAERFLAKPFALATLLRTLIGQSAAPELQA